MKKTVLMIVAVGLISVGLSPVAAQAEPPKTAQASQHKASPLLGTWSLDLSQMPVPADQRPKSVTITFADVGGGKWSTRVIITGQDGNVREMNSAYMRGGAAVAIEGDRMEADIAAVATPAPNVMVLALGKDGHPASTRIYTVSRDGKKMTEEAVSWGDGGTPVIRTNQFMRVKAASAVR